MNTRLLLLLISLGLLSASRAQVYEKVFDLAQESGGEEPGARLALGRDGNFYGATRVGGANLDGTIFKLSPAGVLTTLVSFTSSSGVEESAPEALVEGSDGNFYGATHGNDITSYGTIFRMTPAGTLTTLVSFTGNGASNKGSGPRGPLTQGSDGNFYGVTRRGGASNAGTIFRMTPTGVLTTLVEFTGTNGGEPNGGLVQATNGDFYGTALNGGTNFTGTVFRVTSGGTLTTLVNFTGGNGSEPRAGLVQGSNGLYGTTSDGGANGEGTAFRITLGGTLTTLASFSGADGSSPRGTLIPASDGNFFGTTYEGGTNDLGTVFKLTPAGMLTTVVSLSGVSGTTRGSRPLAGLIPGRDGNLHGVASEGGANDRGTVFKVTTTGEFATVAEFPGEAGANPGTRAWGGLVRGNDGAFYGTTLGGGAHGNGTIFRASPAEGVTTLVDFDGANGSLPLAGLMRDSDGMLYGTTGLGGANGAGTVFKVSTSGVLTTLLHFNNSNGSEPAGRLVKGADGNFYGTTTGGGTNGAGTVFRMTPDGTLTTLVHFTGGNGSSPRAGLLLGSDGNFYGTTSGGLDWGTVFKMTPAGVLTTLVSFSGTTGSFKGGKPRGELIQDSSGFLYGTTEVGGASNLGTVFKLSTDGAFATLVEFSGNGASNKGSYPIGGLIEITEFGVTSYYGTTERGGANGAGTVFEMSTAGVVTTLAEFVSGADGLPRSSMLRDGDGTLYGVTAGTTGAFFRLVFPGGPLLGVATVENMSGGEVVVSIEVNPRGGLTRVFLQYVRVGFFPESSVIVAEHVSGFLTKTVGTTLSGLESATNYEYWFLAENGGSFTVSPTRRFSTLAEPLATIDPASDITPTSARFNGTVNARNFDSTVVFEWGNDGFNFPNIVPAVPGTVTGNSAVAVSADVVVPQGSTVYFRIRASNAGGTVTTGARGFNTGLGVSTSALSGADIGVTDVLFKATINTFGQTAAVKFKYWADSTPQTIFETAAQTVTTNEPQEVSARVAGLLENVTYSYRVSVELAGTETDGGAVAFTTDTNLPPSAVNDLVFYSGQVVVDPLANDTDPNDGSNANLLLAPALVVAPNASLGVASVTGDRRFISYNPQFNVRDDDSLTYRVVDPLGASADGQVRLIAFSKRAGLYGGKIVFGSGASAREGQVAVQMGTGGAISTSFMAWPSEGAGERESFVLKGVFDQRGIFTRTLNSPSGAVLTITLALDPDAPQMLGTFEERVNEVSTTGEIAFVLTKNANTGGLAESGLRTGFLSPPSAQASVMADGYLRMTVGKDARRGARFAGRLPDGEPFLAGARAEGRTYTLARRLEQGGVFTGLVRAIDTSAGAGGMMGNLLWQKRASSRARYERGGVSSVLSLSGVAYPALERGALPPLGADVRLILGGVRRGDGMAVSYRDLLMQLVPGSMAAQFVGSDPMQTSGEDIPLTKLQVKVDGTNAAFRGRFLHPATGRVVPFDGALRMPFDGEPVQGRGIFRGPGAAGSVRLEAD